MDDFTILIGGQAGFGIDTSTSIIASVLNNMGHFIFAERDYPSIIRGGHTFSLIRASKTKILSNRKKVDFLLALNQDTVDLHKDLLKEDSVIIYDSDSVKSQGINIAATSIINEEKADTLMRNSCILGAFFKVIGLKWDLIENILRQKITKEPDLNIKLTYRGYQLAKTKMEIAPISTNQKSLLSGNEAISLGLINASLDAYLAYPMTPSSNILHFLAKIAQTFQIEVLQPESEIAVILMALGFASAGKRVAIGTSGGGFCLMTEGLSFAAMAELPIVIIMGQRPGPSTGLPTYTAQSELNFVLYAGHGEFERFVVAPGDAQEAYYWSFVAMNISWKYQIPSIILTDKLLAESIYSFDEKIIDKIDKQPLVFSQEKENYKRYLNTETGVSPLAFFPMKNNTIKINSYEHDQEGITTEDQTISKLMQEKRKRKGKYLLEALENYSLLNVYGNENSTSALLCFGSNKGVCIEVAKKLNLKVIHIQVLCPFPLKQFINAMKNVKNLISIENNINGQLANLIACHGFQVDSKILKYDGRSFNIEELEDELKRVLNE